MRTLAIFLFFSGLISCALAQHNEFQSLYMYDALQINPAYAGNKGALVLNSCYRNQWSGIKGAPKTLSFNAHLLTRSNKTGLGLSVFNDKTGIVTNLKVNAVYAYKVRFGEKNELSLGIAGGIRNKSIDRDALNLNVAGDIAFLNSSDRTILPDVTLGALYKNDRFLFGISAPDIVKLKENKSFQAVNGYFSALITANRNLKLKPSAFVKYIPHSALSYEGNLTAYYRQAFSAGLGLRSDRSCNLHARLQLNRQFSVAYLFERNFGPVHSYLKNTHEVMLNYLFDFKTNVQSPRYL